MSADNDFSNTIVRLPWSIESAAAFHAPATRGENKVSDHNGRGLIRFSNPVDQSAEETEKRTASGAYDGNDAYSCTHRLVNQSEPIGKS